MESTPYRLQKISIFLFLLLLLSLSFIHGSRVEAQTAPGITGDLQQWHRVTLTFDGPFVSETDPATFWDYRLLVTFSNGLTSYTVPGFFAADGDSANTSATEGDQWRVHFTPDAIGEWTYSASFRTGSDIAISLDPNAGTPISFDGTTGSFNISASTAVSPDFRYHGALRYVGEHYFQFASSGDYYIKAGADSPENFLGYDEFDGTYDIGGIIPNFLHSYDVHVAHWNAGDPTWGIDERGKGIIGALNYLADQGVNSFYFISYNIDGGDGADTWVWTEPTTKETFDVSKLDQWEIVFSHMTKLGIQLHFLTQETENNFDLGGNGDLNPIRQLYYRELVARFAHHPVLQWNLGEENNTSTAQQESHAGYFRALDPYDHPIVVHSGYNHPEDLYEPLFGNPNFEATSIQGDGDNYNGWAITFRDQSAVAGRPWAIYGDEQGPPVNANMGNVDQLRQETLWGNLMGGGAGVEWYFGYQGDFGDLQSEDFTVAQPIWDYTDIAVDFFQTYLPFWDMEPDNSLVADGFAFARTGDTYLVYLPDGGTTTLQLPDNQVYEVFWYNPRTGGDLQIGTILEISGFGAHSLGSPPSEPTEDWAVLVRLAENTPPEIKPLGDLTLFAEDPISLAVSAIDANGNATISLDLTLKDEDDNAVSFASFADHGSGTGTITILPTLNHLGVYTGMLIAEDGVNPPVEQAFSISIIEKNSAPIFDELDEFPAYNDLETIETYPISATDPNDDPLIYSAANLPEGLTINMETGEVTGTITGLPGNYDVTFIATDDGNPRLSSIQTETWLVRDHTVNDPPFMDEIADQTNTQFEEVSLFASAFDEEDDPITFDATGLPNGLSIHPTTGEISGTIDDDYTNYTVTVTASDGINPPSSVEFVWTVLKANEQPVIAPISDQTTQQTTYAELQISATDGDPDDSLTYSASGLATGLSIDPDTGLITGIVTAELGDYTVTITVSDSVTEAVTATFTWTVTEPPPNIPPSVDTISDQSNNENDAVSLQVLATDPEEQPLSYIATGLPSGLSIDLNTGLISGTIANGTAENSPYTVEITVSDGQTFAFAEFSWTVLNDAPDLTNPGNQTATEGDSILLQILATDPESQSLSYNATGLPAGLAIDSTTGLITGNLAVGASLNSPYTVTVAVSDGSNEVDVNFSWTVFNQPPIVLPLSDRTHNENNSVMLQVSATDPETQQLTYSASNLPDGLSIGSSSGLISGTIAIGASANSPYNVTVTVSDASSEVDVNFVWIVNPVPAGSHVTNMELVDVQSSLPVMILSDGAVINPDDYPQGFSIQANTSGSISQIQFSVNGNVTQTESVAPYTIAGDGGSTYTAWNQPLGDYTITATPVNNPSGALTINITLSDVTIDLPPDVSNPGTQNHEEEELIALQISATDAEAQLLSYSAINLPIGLSIDPLSGLISGTLANGSASASPYTVTVTVFDGTTAIPVNFTWIVTVPVNLPPNVSNPGTQNSHEADTISLQIPALDPEAQALTYNATGLPAGLSINSSTGLISGVLSQGSSTGSPYSVTITVSDGVNPVNIDFAWIVINDAPSVSNPGNQSHEEEDSVSLQITATDPEVQPLTYSATGLPAGLSINSSTGLISGNIAIGTATGSPYTVTVTVSDGINEVDVNFDWTVSEAVDTAPNVTTPANQTHDEEAIVSLQIIASDPDSPSLSYFATGLPAGLSINSSTGLISGTIATGTASTSPYNVTVTVSDATSFVPVNFSWIVNEVIDLAPNVTNPGAQENQEGASVSLQIVADDPELQTLTYSANGLPTDLSIDPNTGLISGTLANGTAIGSPYSVTVTVSDGVNPVDVNFEWTVLNLAPDVSNPDDQTNQEGAVISLQIVATDPESQTLNYSASGLPAGISIDPNTGLISGTLANGTATGSPYTVTVTVSDGANPVDVNFEWTVLNLPPNVTTPTAQSHTEGNSVSLQIVATNPESQALNYSASNLPAGLTINPNTGLISGTLSAGASAGSPYSVTITVSDGANPVNVIFSWIVNPVPLGPHVTDMVLINPGTDSIIAPLTDGSVIDLSDNPQGISIVANTSGTISQIQFAVNGSTIQTEGVAPYAIAGDNNGDYDAWNIGAGSYTITATPANNPAGALTISITIVN